ncbi:helix-turn-helix domain-containing protein [Negativibacillus massiliensis]|uniref:helix-turn-helix domain-containing protein n=1 Tax=Negativibacillus massiliensis TaxID=1871035 RepID=UPI003AF29822
MTDPVKIGQRLSNLRGNRTLKEVANAVGISVSALAMYETGKRVPRDEIKVMLARYFNTSVEALFFTD